MRYIMLIPYQQLDEITLNNLIEQYILREGTDYGEVEFSLQEKTQQVLLQITIRETKILDMLVLTFILFD